MDTKKQTPKRKFTWGRCLKYEVDPTGEFIKKTHDLPKSCIDPKLDGSQIQEFFSGAHVLITGSTGFMGKILVEKLLASCPKLSNVYLVIREKKGQTIEERFDKLFSDDVFVRLRNTVPDFQKKVVVVNGDCSQLSLGMSEEDIESLSKKIDVIIHGAATVRFDEKLRTATHINIRGVREILKFARKCDNLKSMVHISTAYANCTLKHPVVEEKFYPPGMDYMKLIKLVDSVSEDDLEKMTPGILGAWPNTYAFTKQVAEDVINQEGKDLPLSVYRPAIVIASYKEPLRGWCDNIYGPTGVIFGVGTGVLRIMHGDAERVANVVPVDTAVNGVIAAAYQTAESYRMKKDITIYNYVSAERNPMTWNEMSYWNDKYGRNWPTMLSVWYPMLISTGNAFLFQLIAFFIHTVPAYITDAFLFITGQKTMLIKGYRKINKFCGVIAYFSKNHWRFNDANVHSLWMGLSEKDKEIFPFDIADVDWDYHAHAHLLGLRTYLVKDPLETLPAAKMKYKRLLAQHVAVIVIFSCGVLWLLSRLIGWNFF